MAKFVFAYVGGAWPETEEEQEAVKAAWGAWFGTLGEAIVDPGNAFGSSASLSSDGTPSTSGTSGLTGYTVVNAADMEAALGMAKGCPLSDGGVIDVYETIDM